MRAEDGLQPELHPLEQVIKTDQTGKINQRRLDLRFYDAENHQILQADIGYFQPMFGNLPRASRQKCLTG